MNFIKLQLNIDDERYCNGCRFEEYTHYFKNKCIIFDKFLEINQDGNYPRLEECLKLKVNDKRN